MMNTASAAIEPHNARQAPRQTTLRKQLRNRRKNGVENDMHNNSCNIRVQVA